MKRKAQEAPNQTTTNDKGLNNSSNASKQYKSFASCPPAYRRPLMDLYNRFNETPIPLSTVHFIFEGYRFSNKRIKTIMTGLAEMGIIELEPMKYIKIVGGS